jgi:hypothetical protein
MSVRAGACGICGKQQTELEEHHVVEYLDEQGRTPKIYICPECHAQQEKYKNYLKNVCGYDLDRKNNGS